MVRPIFNFSSWLIQLGAIALSSSAPPSAPRMSLLLTGGGRGDSGGELLLKQQQLERALNLQEQLAQLQGKLSAAVRRQKQKEEELSAIKVERKELEAGVAEIKKSKGFKDQVGLLRLQSISSLCDTRAAFKPHGSWCDTGEHRGPGERHHVPQLGRQVQQARQQGRGRRRRRHRQVLPDLLRNSQVKKRDLIP